MMPDPDEFVCKCGVKIGKLVRIDGVQFVQIGYLIIDVLHAHCIVCGRGVHSSLPRDAYRRLMALTNGVQATTLEIAE